MNNTLNDLNNYLFEAIERLYDDELTEEKLDSEIRRAETVGKIGKTIVDNARVALSAQKHFDEMGIDRRVDIPLLGVKA